MWIIVANRVRRVCHGGVRRLIVPHGFRIHGSMRHFVASHIGGFHLRGRGHGILHHGRHRLTVGLQQFNIVIKSVLKDTCNHHSKKGHDNETDD